MMNDVSGHLFNVAIQLNLFTQNVWKNILWNSGRRVWERIEDKGAIEFSSLAKFWAIDEITGNRKIWLKGVLLQNLFSVFFNQFLQKPEITLIVSENGIRENGRVNVHY